MKLKMHLGAQIGFFLLQVENKVSPLGFLIGFYFYA